MYMSHRLNKKIALITGASSGIGAATAKRFASEGATVILADIDEKLGTEVTKEIIKDGHQAIFLSLDVTNESNWKKLYTDIEKQFGQLNILVNNAGIAIEALITEFSLEDWRRVMSVNLEGTFLGLKHGIPLIAKSGGGSIVNMSSISGMIAEPAAGAYSASKGGVTILTKVAAVECADAKNNIRVNSIHPGAVATPIFEKGNWQEFVAKHGGEKHAWDAIAKLAPMNRVAAPEEIAAAIAFLASDDSSFMTGSELVVDGGYTIR